MRRTTENARPTTRARQAAAAAALVTLVAAGSCARSASSQGGESPVGDEAAIRELIDRHYVTAVFRSRDEASVRRAFHPAFQLFVLDDGELVVAPLELWLDRLALDGVPSASEVRHEVVFVDVTGDAAVLRTELFVDGEHEYTDYFSLYRFPSDGWRIVTKIFASHD